MQQLELWIGNVIVSDRDLLDDWQICEHISILYWSFNLIKLLNLLLLSFVIKPLKFVSCNDWKQEKETLYSSEKSDVTSLSQNLKTVLIKPTTKP